MKKSFITCAAILALTGCATPQGTFNLKAFDESGQLLNKHTSMIAEGSSVFRARNALCMAYPRAKIIITEVRTRQDLAGESPYQCR
jgi:uncharacterized lipoprotein YajG